jgi:hypothetical protein
MTKNEMIRVVVADDHPVVCKGLCATIQSQSGMQVVGEASDGRQMVEMYREFMLNLCRGKKNAGFGLWKTSRLRGWHSNQREPRTPATMRCGPTIRLSGNSTS